jgi:hypothetical protein
MNMIKHTAMNNATNTALNMKINVALNVAINTVLNNAINLPFNKHSMFRRRQGQLSNLKNHSRGAVLKTTQESGRRRSAPTANFNQHNVQNKPQSAAIRRFDCTLREFESPNSLALNFKKPSPPIKTTGRQLGKWNAKSLKTHTGISKKRINHQSEKQSHS